MINKTNKNLMGEKKLSIIASTSLNSTNLKLVEKIANL